MTLNGVWESDCFALIDLLGFAAVVQRNFSLTIEKWKAVIGGMMMENFSRSKRYSVTTSVKRISELV
jgi:hypothetical protein